MKITPEQFQESFYYIGPGKDFEPLLRFSNQCKFFLFANVYFSKRDILDYIDRFFTNNPFLEITSKSVDDDFNKERYFDLHPKYSSHVSNARFFDPEGREAYYDIFSQAQLEEQWMIKVDFKNRRLNRSLTLYYFTAEGLDSYVALSHNGAYPPKILATIETKMLEKSNGIMLRFFERLGSSPQQWVRGFEGSIYDRTRNNSLKKDSVFSRVGMDFEFTWQVEGSYLEDYQEGPQLMWHSMRFCKTFVKEDYAQKIISVPFKSFGRNEILYGDLYELTLTDLESNVLIVATKHFETSKFRLSGNCQIAFWEDIMANENAWNGKFSMEQSLQKLAVLLRETNADKVYFTPYGMEDEGQLLSDFLSRDSGLSLIAVVNKPLDLIDLRA